MLVKVVPAAMQVEEAVDVSRRLFVFDQEKYESHPGPEIAKMILAVLWWTACLVVIDSVEPNDGNR